MAAIAIPAGAAQAFAQDESTSSFYPLSCSPLSRSPFLAQLSLSPNSAPKYSSVVPSANQFAQVRRKSSVSAHARPVIRPPTQAVPREAPLPAIHSGAIIDNFRAALDTIDMDDCEAHGENAFFVADLAEVYRQHVRWMRELGHRVQPFFAVKSNPDPYVLHLMAALGMGFDCASQPEISAVLGLPGPVSPSRIIYANPCKAASFIRNAAKCGVDTMTFDNADELAKVKKYHPNARMVLRILTDDSSSLCRLGLKFGAPLSEVRGLLKRAKQLDVNVVGISFHCGSGCKDPSLFGDAIRRARWAFDVGAEEGFDFDLLDIGGGFEDDNFEQIAAVLREAIDAHFPLDAQGKGVKVIAEPGRYYVCRAFELATNIIARRAAREGTNDDASMLELAGVDDEEAKPVTMYYINDGVYSSFNSTMFDHQVVHPHVLTLAGDFHDGPVLSQDADFEECSIWGPTCDSIDCVQPKAVLPTNLIEVGDWLRWDNMGAYTICAASQFNGFRRSDVRYTIDAKGEPGLEAKIRALLDA
ncbi:hypothetical protein NBRC10512_003015 [Rhodotorula toruloides]|uniref:ornithine decarboxylase n=2 Tax=Rhodotorula toruloides TaxID=5286 RepID=A0A061BDG6_RHOTO|nr:ornithine decarboxylase [Rhodotorula toruloides NP11]EMS24854.1 ornithine decarboxylase [Rhodotorula toruloides NP11]CDR47412.1 RHTO0S14e03378g1_1 [Rhodotorula toruloides]